MNKPSDKVTRSQGNKGSFIGWLRFVLLPWPSWGRARTWWREWRTWVRCRDCGRTFRRSAVPNLFGADGYGRCAGCVARLGMDLR